jgi:hypothetical protein
MGMGSDHSGGLWQSDPAAAAAAALFAGGHGGPGAAGPGQGNLGQQLQELQIRHQQAAAAQLQAQQHQQHVQQQLAIAQMQALQAAGGMGNLSAAAQILSAAGLGHHLGAPGPGQPPLPGSLGPSAAHILQHAGLGMPGLSPAALGAYAQHLGLSGQHAALLAAQVRHGGARCGLCGMAPALDAISLSYPLISS